MTIEVLTAILEGFPGTRRASAGRGDELTLASDLDVTVFAGRGGASGQYVAGVCGLAAMTAAPVVTWFWLPSMPAASAGPAAPGWVVEHGEPLRGTREHVEELLDRAPDAGTLVQMLRS